MISTTVNEELFPNIATHKIWRMKHPLYCIKQYTSEHSTINVLFEKVLSTERQTPIRGYRA